MVFPNGGASVCAALYEKHKSLAEGTEDQRRDLTWKIAQTFSAKFGPRWGTKSTTVNHPRSKDAIAYQNDDGTIDVWDWQNGTTRKPSVVDGSKANYTNLPHNFIAVPPVDHLAEEIKPNPIGEEPKLEGEALALLKEIVTLQKKIVELLEQLVEQGS